MIFKNFLNRNKTPLNKSNKKFDAHAKDLDKLKLVLVIVKKGHGIAINDLLLSKGISMSMMFFAEGTKEKYVMDILGGEETSKECILSLVPTSKYNSVKQALKQRFEISNASKGLLLTFDVKKMTGVFAYKYLTDFGGAMKYANKKEE